ncbi:MAG: transposase [Pirellulales bacterium]|nr:transposase [Pirellulales bacterium]
MNAYAERFVLSLRQDCLERMIFFGERSLRNALNEYTAHYHAERNHQGLGNQLIEPNDDLDSQTGKVNCRERLGGMLKYYHRQVA